jgi:Rod binding domain-containing protein
MAPALPESLSGKFLGVQPARAESTDASSLAGRQASFSQIIARETGREETTPEQRARRAAEQFVASSLVEPILKQMRSASDIPPPFGPSQAEKQFRSLMDTQVARNIVTRANWPVVDRVAADLIKRTKGVRA